MNVMKKNNIRLLLLNFLLIVASQACSNSCECDKGVPGYVDCRNKELSAVPDDIPPNATILHLEHNKITSLSPNDFGKLVNLTEVWLDDNDISQIEDETFTNNSNLQTLSLSRNQLNDLNKGAFTGATQLEILNLLDNPDLSVEEGVFQTLVSLKEINLSNTSFSDHSYDFENMKTLSILYMNSNQMTDLNFLSQLPNLEVLQLYWNRISEIPLDTFNNTQRLNEIYIDSNRIETLQSGVFLALNNVSVISLKYNRIQTFTRSIFNANVNLSSVHFSVSENPINCDCKMKWLSGTSIQGQCYEPTIFNGFDFDIMNLTDYQCAPTANEEGDLFAVSKGDDITIACPVAIDPLEFAFWEVSNKTNVSFSSLPDPGSDISLSVTTGELEIKNAKMEYRGVYRCTFGNLMGNLSNVVFVDVDEAPIDSGVIILALSVSLAGVSIFSIFLLCLLFRKRLKGSAASRYRFLLESSGEGITAEI